MMSSEINELATALAIAQGATQNAFMNRVNPHFKSKYADLSSVLDAIRLPLSSNGLSIVQTMQTNEYGMFLQTTLMHSSGQYITSEYPLPGPNAKAHEIGSALTYGRRYSIAALICNSADEDDDGNSAMADKPTMLPKKDAKGIYTKLQKEVDEQETRAELIHWMRENAERIKVLPEDWSDILRLRCQELMLDLQNKEPKITWEDDGEKSA